MKKAISISNVICISIIISVFMQSGTSQPSQWLSNGLGGGGALFSPSISPFNNNEVYIVCDMGGIYHSGDTGNTWQTLDFRQISSNIESRINFTSSPDTLYSIGNYDWPDYRRPVRSVDGGNTWTGLSGDPTNAEVYYLFADPNNTKRIIMSSYSDLYFSNDAGVSFSNIYSNDDLYIGGVFWDDSNIFIGCRDGLLVSHDNGVNFSLENFNDDIPDDYGILSLTGAKESGNIRMFCVARLKSDMWPGLNPVEYWSMEADVFRLDYTGVSGNGWVRKNTGLNADDFPYFVSMSNNSIDTVYVAGGSDIGHPMIYKTVDGANNWSNVFHTINNQNIKTGWMGDGGDLTWPWAESVLGFCVASDNNNYVVVSDWGFAHISIDGGNTWQQIYVPSNESNPAGTSTPKGKNYHSNGLEVTSSWWLTWIDENNIFASYTDITGMKSTDGGNTWNFDFSGNNYNSTYMVIKRPDNNNLYAAVSSVHDIYQSTHLEDNNIDNGTGEILISSDSGSTWTTLYDFGHPVIWVTLSPNDPDKMYASIVHSTQGGIFYSSDAGTNWTKLNNPPRTEGHPFNIRVLNDNTLVCSYSGRRDANGDFTESSGVFYSTDNGNTWYDRSHPDMYRWTKDVVIDPHDSDQNTWYACVFSHWGHYPNEVGGVFKTTDRGVNWIRLNDLYRVNSLTVHPDFPDIVYITTETQGLWYSSDFSQGNPNFSQLNYPYSQPMRLFFNPYNHNELWLTSFGIGTSKGITHLGRTYYVSTTGNDNNTGLSIAEAWRTIGKAANTIMSGDTVYVLTGIYNERVIVKYSGVDSNYISFLNYQNDSVIIDGTGISWGGAWNGLFDISDKDYIVIDGINVKNSDYTGIWIEDASHIIIKNNHTYNTFSSGIGVWNSNDVTVENNEVELACNDGPQECITISNSNNCKIFKNHVHNNGPGNKGGEGIDVKQGSHNIEVYDNLVHHLNERIGIYVDAWNDTTYNINIYNNEVHHCGNNGFNAQSEMGGELSYVNFYNNLSYFNKWDGIALGSVTADSNITITPVRHIKIINNTCYKNGYYQNGWGYGILVDNDDLQDVLIINNICSQNSAQIAIEKIDSAQQVDHNLIFGFNDGQYCIYGNDSIIANPLFMDTINFDFHLQNGSPAIDKGIFIDSLDFDCDSVPRPLLANPDIGAYEFGIWWNGNVDNDWHTAGNWSNGHIPIQSDSVTIPSNNFYKFFPKIGSNAQVKKVYLNENGEIIIKENILFEVLE